MTPLGRLGRRRWIPAALLVGVVYFVVGRLFSVPADQRFWRLAAWVVSAAAYAAHIGYEHWILRNPPRSTALHTALAAAVGGFLLAVAATVHSFLYPSPTQHRGLFTLALVAWPIVTGVPAYIVALVVAAVLGRIPRAEPRT